MKKYIVLLLLTLPYLTHAQLHRLEANYHGMRVNDSIVKIQVHYQSPGKSGLGVEWNFSELKPVDDAYPLHYYINLDSIFVGREHDTSYWYEQTDDSVFMTGYSNHTTYFEYMDKELLLTYPFAYGDSLTDYFYGEGVYGSKLHILILGKSFTKADGYGTLILPDCDTLFNVVRVFSEKSFIERMSPADSILYSVNKDDSLLAPEAIGEYLGNDSIVLKLESYRWYARGYRYPVFETLHSKIYKLGELYRYFETAFFYPPRRIYLSGR